MWAENTMQQSINPNRQIHIRALVLLTGILVIAALFRFIWLDYAPAGGHGDVSWLGINALDWVDRGIWPFYVREMYSPEFFPVYLTGLLLPLTGVAYLPLRIITAAAGVLFVAFLYPATYWLIGPKQPIELRVRAGLLSALADERQRDERQSGLGAPLEQRGRFGRGHLDGAGREELQVFPRSGRVLDRDRQPLFGEESPGLGHVDAHKGQVGLRLVAGHEGQRDQGLRGRGLLGAGREQQGQREQQGRDTQTG